MATTVNGNSFNWGYGYVAYTTSSDNVSYTITASAGVYRKGNVTAGDGELFFSLAGWTKASYSGTYPKGTGNYTVVSSKSYKYTKTHSSQTASVEAFIQGKEQLSVARKSFTIPAKPSYTVVYNANSGSGAPANQTKWYGESLQISPTKPTKSGYIFRGWATSQANANAGTVSYAAGANYTGNAALTLYAVWELAYTLPVINNLTVERCNDDGSDNDEGTYAKVSFDWSVFESNEPRYYGGSGTPFSGNTASIVITVGTLSKTISAPSSASITEVIDASVTDPFIVDNEYPVVITIEDTQTVISNNTRTVTSRLLTPAFILDANADATAVGILKSAPDDGQGVYLGGDVHAEEKTGYFGDIRSVSSVRPDKSILYNRAIVYDCKSNFAIAEPGMVMKNARVVLCGRICQLIILATNTNSVASGSNFISGHFSGVFEKKTAPPHPRFAVNGVSYYGKNSIIGLFSQTGELTIRNASPTALTIGSANNFTMSFTYIVEDNFWTP